MRLIIQPFTNQALGEILKTALKGECGEFHTFQAAVAFAKNAGIRHIQDELREFILQGKNARIVVGIDHYGTSQEGLEGLLKAVGEQGEVWINHSCENYITFHPKIYLFEGNEDAILIIGSGNLTEGGLYTNDEASSLHRLSLDDDSDKAVLDELKKDFDSWCNEKSENAKRLDRAFLNELVKRGYVFPEIAMRSEGHIETITNGKGIIHTADDEYDKISLFGKTAIKRSAPKFKKIFIPKTPKSEDSELVQDPISFDKLSRNEPRGFVMTLQRTQGCSILKILEIFLYNSYCRQKINFN